MAQPQPVAFPVSIKGVVVRDGRVLLLKNERDEWELPGGRPPSPCPLATSAASPRGFARLRDDDRTTVG